MTTERIALVQDRIVPRIKPRRFFAVDAPVQPAYHRALGTHLGIGIGIDHGERIEYVWRPDERWGVSEDEIDEIAFAKVPRLGGTGAFKSVAPGLFLGDWDDDYALERMLIPALFSGLPLDGAPVVFPCAARQVMVCGSNDVAAQKRIFVTLLKQALQPLAFVLDGDRWSSFEPEGELADAYGNALAFHLASAYVKAGLSLEVVRQGEQLIATVASSETSPIPRATHVQGRGTSAIPWREFLATAKPTPAGDEYYPPVWVLE